MRIYYARIVILMTIRGVPTDVWRQFKAIAGKQRRRLRDLVTEALREKVERHRGEFPDERSFREAVEALGKKAVRPPGELPNQLSFLAELEAPAENAERPPGECPNDVIGPDAVAPSR
jgi:hypothetical protein